jgi:hypothetical protein
MGRKLGRSHPGTFRFLAVGFFPALGVYLHAERYVFSLNIRSIR